MHTDTLYRHLQLYCSHPSICIENTGGVSLKVALQILGRNFYQNTKKSSLYSQSFQIFIHRTPAVERHPITRESRDLLWPRSTLSGNTVYSYMSSTFIYNLKIHRRSFKHSFRWRYNGKYYMFVILRNLSVISHWIFPQYFFFYFWRQI